MVSYHVFSTTDLVHWTDYGVMLHLKDVRWAASHMWAIDAVLWKGTYYLVYCAQEKDKGFFRTGLATSRLPQGLFTDIGYIRGVAVAGAQAGPSRVTLLLEAENGAVACGELYGTWVAADRPGFSGSGYVTGLERSGRGVAVMSQVGQASKYRLKVRFSADHRMAGAGRRDDSAQGR